MADFRIEGGVLTMCRMAAYEEIIRVPDGVREIGNGAFGYGAAARRIILPESVVKIGDDGFLKCDAEEILLPEHLQEIGIGGFVRCDNLRGIRIPHSVKRIGAVAFFSCQSLQSVRLPAGITKIENSTFSCCSALRGIFIPDGVTEIETEAFYRCDALRRIRFPAKLAKIGDYAFDRCDAITEPLFGAPPQPDSPLIPLVQAWMTKRPEIAVWLYRQNMLTKELAEFALKTAQNAEDTEMTALMLEFLHRQPAAQTEDMTL